MYLQNGMSLYLTCTYYHKGKEHVSRPGLSNQVYKNWNLNKKTIPNCVTKSMILMKETDFGSYSVSQNQN